MNNKVSMKMVEKLIRLEQTNIASLKNKNINYKQTEYFKGLSQEDKDRFEKHMNQKRRLPGLFAAGIILPLVLYSLTKVSFTGNVIAENLDRSTLGALGAFFISMSAGALALFLYHFISRRNFERAFYKNSGIFDDFVTNKPTIRRY